MTRTASAHGLTPEPARAWLATAPCKADPDAMFPGSDDHAIEYAKSFCHACPAIDRCLQWALETGEQFGVWGGLSEKERRKKRRQTQRKDRRQQTTPKPPKAPSEPPPTTVEEAFSRRARTAAGGHVIWHGASQIRFQSVKYNPLHIAFKMGHGRDPQGRVERTCGRKCYAPEHLTDAAIRDTQDVCGTTTGYWRHRRKGEPTCPPCRRANADADNRLRRTGTTKVLAA